MHVFIKGRTHTSLSDACRQRLMELREGDDEGPAQFEARKKRNAVPFNGGTHNVEIAEVETKADPEDVEMTADAASELQVQ